MTARELAFAIDPRARRVGRNYRVRCVSHDDHHASLDIADAQNGKLLLIDRSGRCSQREIIEELRARGLWSSPPATRRRWSWSGYLARTRLRPRPYRPSARTRREYLLARLRDDLTIAKKEIETLYARARCELTRDDLLRELRLALELPGINAAGLSAPEIEAAISICIENRGGDGRDAA
jgi:hypothetical protein